MLHIYNGNDPRFDNIPRYPIVNSKDAESVITPFERMLLDARFGSGNKPQHTSRLIY